MMKAWLLAALLLAGLLAGCAGKTPTTPAGPAQPDFLSPQVFAIKAPELVMLPASTDQTRLEVALYRPDTAEKVPVFVNFSPYWGDTAMREGDAFSKHFIQEYVPRGYAVALASVRGTGHSEGCFQIGGDLELKDAHDVVDFLAKQPWSNGNVGAGGKSYDSTTQNGLVAKFPHPALKALFHVSGITDMYRYSAKDGVAYEHGLSFTPRYFLVEGADEYGVIPPPLGSGGGDPQDESPASLQRLVGDLACPELAKHLQGGEGTAASGVKDAYWQERDWIRHLPESTWTGSVFFVHGFQDWNVKPDHIDPWLQALAAKGNPVKGWLHQWEQGETGGHVYPMRTDWNTTMLRWLDHHLKGVDNGIDRELGFDLQGSDTVWRRSTQWPPAGRSAHASGNLVSGTLEVARAPTPLRITGTPSLTVAATSLSADPILYARLLDVAPNGTTLQVNEAARRGALNADLSAASPWPPGETRDANLTFYPMDHVLLPEHRLLLQVGLPAPAVDSDARALGPAGNAGFVITPAQGRVTYGEGTLHFTLLDASANRIDPQPQSMKCFAC